MAGDVIMALYIVDELVVVVGILVIWQGVHNNRTSTYNFESAVII
jgi:hypothetical protein